MAGMFELFNDEDAGFRFRIRAPDGTVMAVSRSFPDKPSAVAGIRDVREYAGMGHITDLCPAPPAAAVSGPAGAKSLDEILCRQSRYPAGTIPDPVPRYQYHRSRMSGRPAI